MHGNHWTKQNIAYGKDGVPIWPRDGRLKCKCGNKIGQLAFHMRFARYTNNLPDLGWLCAKCLDNHKRNS